MEDVVSFFGVFSSLILKNPSRYVYPEIGASGNREEEVSGLKLPRNRTNLTDAISGVELKSVLCWWKTEKGMTDV